MSTGKRPPPGASPPSIPTAPTEDVGLALPPVDAVTGLRVVGTDLPELRLAPEVRLFTLGSDDRGDVDLRVSSRLVARDRSAREHVSRVHLQLHRKGNRLWLKDLESTNGTYINEHREREGYVEAGESFRVGNVALLALDDRLRTLRSHLLWSLGLTANEVVDRALMTITTGKPLLLIGPRGCGQATLAEQIHATSPRRGHGYASVALPFRDRAEQLAPLVAATRGTAFLDLAEADKLPAFFVEQLFGDTYQVRAILAAPDPETAADLLGLDHFRTLEAIRIPPIVDRRADVPRLLDAILRAPPISSTRSLDELGADRVARLADFDWPDNLDDLRRNAPRILAFLESGGNLRAAARSLGVSHQSLGEALARIGLRDSAAARKG